MLKVLRALFIPAVWGLALTGAWWLPDGVAVAVTGIAIAATLADAIAATHRNDILILGRALDVATRPGSSVLPRMR